MNWVNGTAWNAGSELTSVGGAIGGTRGALVKRKSGSSILRSALQVIWERCAKQVKNTAQHAFDDRWLYDSKTTSSKTFSSKAFSSKAFSSKTGAQMPIITESDPVKQTALASNVEKDELEGGVFEDRIIENHHSETRLSTLRPKGTITEVRSYSCAGNTNGASEKHGVDNAGIKVSDRINELQTLLPALAGFCQDRWLVLIAPPRRPDIETIIAAGIDPSRVLIIHAQTTHQNSENGLQIVEAALRSGTCGAVVAWLETCDSNTLARLEKAAEVGHAWGVMFRGICTNVVTQSATGAMPDKTYDKMPTKTSTPIKSELSIIQSQSRQEKSQAQHVADIWFDDSQTASSPTNNAAFFSDKPAQIEMAIN